MMIFHIFLSIISLSALLCGWIGYPQAKSLLETTYSEVLNYWTLHQEMWFIGYLGDLIASIIFCRKSLSKLWSEILKIIRFPQHGFEISKDIKLFCLMVLPLFVLAFLRHKFFPTWSLSYPSIYWWIVPSTIAYIIVPLILIKCDKSPSDRTEITEKEAKIIVFVQLLSFFPGIYRFYAVIGAMRHLGYTCLQAFRCYILISIPLDILNCVDWILSIADDNFLWERMNISLCAIVLILFIVFGYLILRVVELFWSRISLTSWSIFYMIIGIFRMSYSAYFVLKNSEAIKLVYKLLWPFF